MIFVLKKITALKKRCTNWPHSPLLFSVFSFGTNQRSQYNVMNCLIQITHHTLFRPQLSDGSISEAPRRVSVEGGPGSGRTTLCLRLLYQWATQGDGPALAFIVPLRELRGGPLLTYLTRELFPRNSALADSIQQVWRTLQLLEDRVLFVLDGYDECPAGRASLGDAADLLEGRLFPEARVLVTCSANDAPTIGPLVQRRLHLAGLEWPHVERLCVAYFIHNDMAEKACEFLEVLNVQPLGVRQLAQHPLGWIMLCVLYQVNSICFYRYNKL